MSKRPRTEKVLAEKVLEISPTPKILTLQPEDLFKSRVELTCPPKDLGTITVRIPCQPTDGYFDTFAKVQGFLDGIETPKADGSLNWVFSPPPTGGAPERAYHEYTLAGSAYGVTIKDGDATSPYSVYTEMGIWKDCRPQGLHKRTIIITKPFDYPSLSDKIRACEPDKKGVLLIFADGPPDTLPTNDEFISLNGIENCYAQYYLTKDGKNRINSWPSSDSTAKVTPITFRSIDKACPVPVLYECIRATKDSGKRSVLSFFYEQGDDRKLLAGFWKQIPKQTKTCPEMSFVGIALKCALSWWALNDLDATVNIAYDMCKFGDLNLTSAEAARFAKELLDPSALVRKKSFLEYTEHQATFLGIPLNDLLQKYQDGGYYNARFGIHSENIDDMYGYPSNRALPIRSVYDGIKAAFVDRCLVFQ